MKFCYFPKCGKTSLTVFKAPENQEIRDKWVEFIKTYKTKFKDTPNFSLCEIHFDLEDIINGNARNTLKKGSFPTLSGVSYIKFNQNMIFDDFNKKFRE